MRLTGKVKSFNFAYTMEHKNNSDITYEEDFYKIELEIPRLSDNIDIIPVYCSEKLILDMNIQENDILQVNGEIRTRNITEEDGTRYTDVYGYANEIEHIESIDIRNANIIELEGIVRRTPKIRKTLRSDRTIANATIAIRRKYGYNDRFDYIPCILWGRDAILGSKRNQGDRVSLIGRFQSREYYNKNKEISITVYEVSVIKMEVLEKVDETTVIIGEVPEQGEMEVEVAVINNAEMEQQDE